MEVDDVVDLSIPSNRDTLSRDLRALTQNAGLTITPAPPPPQIISLIEQQQPQPMEESGGHAGTGSGKFFHLKKKNCYKKFNNFSFNWWKKSSCFKTKN